MKKINLSIKLTTLSALLVLTIYSCRKKEMEPEPEPEPDTEQTTAQDHNAAEIIANDIEAMGAQASENSELTTFRSSQNYLTNIISVAPCATVSSNGGTITVDFGSGCAGPDGKTRSGKLYFDHSISSPTNAIYYRNPGYAMKISSQNYVVDGNQINIINKTISNITPTNIPTGTNPGTNLTWSISANISITKAGGGAITWSCNRTKELTNTSDPNCYGGQSTPINWLVAIVKLNGTATGTNAKNETFTATATDLVRDFTCMPDPQKPKRRPFVSGTINYAPGSRPARLVDYGSGTCDLNATITIKGKVFNITL